MEDVDEVCMEMNTGMGIENVASVQRGVRRGFCAFKKGQVENAFCFGFAVH